MYSSKEGSSNTQILSVPDLELKIRQGREHDTDSCHESFSNNLFTTSFYFPGCSVRRELGDEKGLGNSDHYVRSDKRLTHEVSSYEDYTDFEYG